MEKEASARSPAAKIATGDAKGHGETTKMEASPSVSSSNAAPRRTITLEEKMAAITFLKAAHQDAIGYIAMTEDEVEEEYRRAGKLHRYDPDNEWKKRYARVARVYPPPKFVAPHLDEYMKYLEEDEADEAPESAGQTN